MGLLGLGLALVLVVGGWVLKYRSVVNRTPIRKSERTEGTEPVRRVNPFIGTGGIPWVCGHNFPGAMTPFGMVRLGPETASIVTRSRALNTSGYYYGDDQLLGFSHTRLNGTGATDGGHFLVIPTRDLIEPSQLKAGYTTSFSHSDEMAEPGYYSVVLRDIGARVELTATPRVGVHRYTFDETRGAGSRAHLMLDVSNALGGRRSGEGSVRVLPGAREVEGTIKTYGTFAGRYGGLRVYFVARSRVPIKRFGTWIGETRVEGREMAEGDRVGVDLGFDLPVGGGSVELALAISHVSVANARANLDEETRGREFDTIRRETLRAWEERLSTIQIEGGSERDREIFYTALYRTFQMPTLFQDVNGEYIGFDRKTHRAEGFRYYTDFSMWDTFRTVHPLYTLIASAEQQDFMNSLVRMLEQGGWLPRWPSGHGYSNSMLGTPADIVMAEAYLKGIRGFDIEKAYQAMRRTALGATPPGAAFSGREGVDAYLKHGYCPSDRMEESVARTLEFAWSDRAIALLAERLGHREDAALFRGHAGNYRNLWNPATQYFQPRDAAGRFFEPFKPKLLTYLDLKGKYTKAYVEGSALQWRWAVPHDAEGLIGLFRSREYFAEQLNAFFAEADSARGGWNPGPNYWHGNQPDIHAAYLFNDAGRPDLTQKWVRWILENKYSDTYDGLDGNDDGGTLSAWYVFSALGFYPVAGTDRYELGAPLFERATMRLKDGVLRVETENHAPRRWAVRRVRLNGEILERRWIRHSEIERGGTLRFEMVDGVGK